MSTERAQNADADAVSLAPPAAGWSDLWKLEDWWAVWLGAALLAGAFAAVSGARPADWSERLAAIAVAKSEVTRLEQKALGSAGEASGDRADIEQAVARQKRLTSELSAKLVAPFKGWVGKPAAWKTNPRDAVYVKGKSNAIPAIAAAAGLCLISFGIALRLMGYPFLRFAAAFVPLFALAVVSYAMASHEVIKWANLEYPLWALLVGLSISNTIGTPAFLKPAVRTEFYIKTGLVLLGAEVLLSQLVALGLPGICISWIVTPIVLVGTYMFGQRVLRMESKTLNLVVSADMSVCGVSAAIATAAACRAKKEELSLAIGISLAFTVVMMILMPMFISWAGIDRVVGAAWIGGTIDATGAVAAAGAILGEDVLPVAAAVKMIQNILIGVIAFAVAVYWVTYEERSSQGPAPSLWEIWYRFPRFILGFVLASAVFSTVYSSVPGGEYLAKGVVDGCTKTLREWFFCLAFVSIGLETNFRELAGYLKGGKPLMLYVCGQAFSLVLSLGMCWLMLKVVFPNAAANLAR